MSAQAHSSAKMKELRLPISRVKTIMKSSPYVDTVGQDGLFLVTKATVRMKYIRQRLKDMFIYNKFVKNNLVGIQWYNAL